MPFFLELLGARFPDPNLMKLKSCATDPLRSIQTLTKDLSILDTEYNTLGDLMAEGEQEKFSPGCPGTKAH